MQIRLQTLTPLHVGNGEELFALDYVVHQSRFYRIGQGKFIQFLQPLGKDAANRFSAWVLEKTYAIENLKAEKEEQRQGRDANYGDRRRDFNQELAHLQRTFNYLSFSDSIGQKDAFLQFLRANVPSIPIFSDGMKQQVRGLIKTASGNAYLPGSSLKGALRTAMLFHLLKEKIIPVERVTQILTRAISEVQNLQEETERRGKRFKAEKLKVGFGDKLEEEAFYCKTRNERGRLLHGEEQYDLLKLLLVSDAYPEKQSLGVDNVDSYLVSKIKDKATKKMVTKADLQPQPPSVEIIADGQVFNCHVEFNIEFLLNIKGKLHNGQIENKGSIHWIGIEEKVKNLFNLDLATLTAANLEEKRTAVLSHVLACVKRFSLMQLEHDRRWLQTFYENDVAKSFTDKMKEGFHTVLQRPNATLFNLGYASGFQGTTEALYYVAHCKPAFKTIMELFGIGDKPGANKNRRPGETYIANPDRFPKSKRLITRSQEILPPGWLVLLDGHEALATDTGSPTAAPVQPSFPKGPLRQNLEIFAEIVQCGTPNKIKLLLSETHQPLLDLRWGMGFPPEKKGSYVLVKISAMKGKDAVQAVSFVRFV